MSQVTREGFKGRELFQHHGEFLAASPLAGGRWLVQLHACCQGTTGGSLGALA